MIFSDSGTRVVLLNCLAEQAHYVMRQAFALGMTDNGWAWIVTDGVTTMVRDKM